MTYGGVSVEIRTIMTSFSFHDAQNLGINCFINVIIRTFTPFSTLLYFGSMDYRLELLSEDDFEKLVNRICQKILGIGVIAFSKGKDGGKDGKFTGTSQGFPSATAPWTGKFIIQAKHTDNPIASCSDNDFNTLVNKEIKRLFKFYSIAS